MGVFCVQTRNVVLDKAQRKRIEPCVAMGILTMKPKFLLALAVAMPLAGCTTSPKSDVYTYRNDIGGPSIDMISDNELDSGQPPTEIASVNASRIPNGAWGS